MPIPWGQHLDLARCAASIGEHDLGAATVALAGALHLLQRDLLIDPWSVRTPEGAVESHLRTYLRTHPLQIAENTVPEQSEVLPYKEIVTGSIPVSSISYCNAVYCQSSAALKEQPVRD